nr:MAG TPA: hypothetical protein [Bacteriophage sp.]
MIRYTKYVTRHTAYTVPIVVLCRSLCRLGSPLSILSACGNDI